MKGLLGRRTLFLPLTALLLLAAVGGSAQQAAAPAAVTAAPAAAAAPGTPAASTATAPAAEPASSSSPALQIVTLEQSVAAARASAPGLKLATATLDTAHAQLTQVRATNGLSLAGKGGYTHQGTLPGTTTSSTAANAAAASAAGSGLNGENIQGRLSLSGPATSIGLTAQHSIEEGASGDQVSSLALSASQTVFDGYPGGRASAAVQQAVYDAQIAQVTYEATLKSVIYQVKQAYYTLLGDQNTVLVRQASVTQAQQNLAYYEGLLTAGRATQLDVLQSQVALTQAQLDLASARNTVSMDRKTLSATVGWPLDKQYSAADTALPELPAVELQDALKTAFQNRSELLTLGLNVAAADVNLALQKSQAYPVISANGSVGVGQDWTANVSTGTFTAGVSIALPIVDGGLRSAQEQQAASQLAAFKVQQDQQTRSITIAVENALYGVRDARNRLDLAGQSVKASQGQYDLEKARYAVGLVTTLDVLTSLQALTSAQVALEQAKSNYVLAVLNLNNVMGV